MKGMISPSMMCANFFDLKSDIRLFERLDIEYLHVDIMDGRFVPNFTLGTDYVKKLKSFTNIPVDIHLMIERPEDKLDWFCFSENDIVSFHYEATNHVHRVIQRIKSRGAKAFLALCPATPLCVLEDSMPDLDGVLIMTVNPGFAGQELVEQTIDKIARLRDMYPNTIIEVDGNVSFENAVKMRTAGANIYVAGSSSVFINGDIEANTQKLRNCIT
ncbi:MAG: ribulose-phosphate 3-epimerase [Oscillospiraceae bacterium]|jgi:ribulose-phosphate 3-epimerase|nr:ribulose-phosphate 3-epimerase [Oscillospiraceae bacterium]